MDNSDATARKRGVLACRACRSLKVKCLPSKEPDTCQRCLAAGRECTWLEKARTRKRRGPSRIIQVEEKLDGLVARLNDVGTTGASERKENESRRVANGISPSQSSGYENAAAGPDIDQDLASIHAFDREDESSDSISVDEPSNNDAGPIGTEDYTDILGDTASLQEAERLFEEYRTMAKSFPFVPIPLETTFKEMHRRKPMVLLAVLAAASWRNGAKQSSFSDRYRYELSQKAIFRPRKSVPLVQSLLIYLAWYHFYFSHRSQNILPLLHLLVGLARDLGLQQRNKKSMVTKRKKPLIASPSQIRESQRAILGCFYLSAAITTSTAQRVNLLDYNDYMDECCEQLHAYGEYESDSRIRPLIALRKIDQHINDLIAMCRSVRLDSDTDILARIRQLEMSLNNWRIEHHLLDYQSAFDLSQHYANLELHSVGLSDELDDDAEVLSPTSISGPAQWEMLNSSLESAKCFLDTLLAIPTTEYHLITFVHWMRLPRVVIAICKLSFPSVNHLPQWDVKMAQDRVRLDLYLESLCYRMQKLGSKATDTKSLGFWQALQMIMEHIRNWYLKKISPPALSTSIPSNSTVTTPFDSSNADTMVYPTPASHTFLADGSTLPEASTATCAFGTSMLNPEYSMPPGFDPDRFMDMEFWGGTGSYDPTIYDPGEFNFH